MALDGMMGSMIEKLVHTGKEENKKSGCTFVYAVI